MARLSEAAQWFVVGLLARWTPSHEVQRQCEERFGAKPTLPQLSHYDPTNASAKELRAELVTHFNAERERAKRELDSHPVGHLAIRVQRMWERMERLESRGNDLGAQAIARDIERTLGGKYSNRVELTGKDGGPIRTEDAGLTDEQRAERVTALLERARARRDGQPPGGD